MTREEAIKYLRQIYPNGGHCWLDEQRIEALDMAIQALSVSLPEGLDGATEKYREYREKCGINDPIMLVEIADAYYAGAEWGAEHLKR